MGITETLFVLAGGGQIFAAVFWATVADNQTALVIMK